MKYFTSTEKATGLLPINECFAVSKTANLEVTVKPGGVMINGITAFEDNETKLTISPADTIDRIDTVVVRLLDNIPHEEVDVISGDIPSSMGDALKYKQSAYKSRAFEIAVVKGIPSETPKAPELRRDDRVYELGVANVHVSGVSISEVTDTRYDDTRCGFADSIVSELLNRAGGSGDSSGYKTAFVRFTGTNTGNVLVNTGAALSKGKVPVIIDNVIKTVSIDDQEDQYVLKSTLPKNANIKVITVIPSVSYNLCGLKNHPEIDYSSNISYGYLQTNSFLLMLNNLGIFINQDGTMELMCTNIYQTNITIRATPAIYAIVYYD